MWTRTRSGVGAALLLLAACTDAADVTAERLDQASVIEPAARPSTTTSSTTVPETTTTTIPALVAPIPASTPEAMAQRLSAAETTVRDTGSSLHAYESAGFELQVLYRQLSRTPGWETSVLAAVPQTLRGAVEANIAARRQFRGMHSKLSDTLPAWRIIEPASATDLLSFYREGQETFGVPWEILAAVNLVETGMGRIEGFSTAGARGPMQFIAGTWAAFGEGDIDDPHDAIMAAARYLAHNGGGRGDIDNALFRYNNSNRYVEGVKAYAAVMAEDPQAFHGFYHWQVVYLSTIGDIWLPVGYESPDRIAVTDYVAANPEHHLGTSTD